MKILLCYPPVSEEYEKIRDAGVAPHLSLLCLGTHIKKTFEDVEVDLCDGHHVAYEMICAQIRKENYDVIGFSVDFTNYITSVRLANFARIVTRIRKLDVVQIMLLMCIGRFYPIKNPMIL